ncbi:hypothetical protein [Kyrpidia spormannii]|uniref:Uncharacterized protein n=2 Tax=Kyrpidia spormannii TaxID=2055160 RepID=A0ACA8ZDK5_9BACL|nr:hypothetical protein [Kyrpidia spormannii]CAB3395209.1 protein of unknown function [Kyrpidia spormannii]CAB3396032.1 protein of unknown function [Kyrpidia spormannii]
MALATLAADPGHSAVAVNREAGRSEQWPASRVSGAGTGAAAPARVPRSLTGKEGHTLPVKRFQSSR